jgi:hypothetical protein
MFIDELKTDLLAIFDVKKITFSSVLAEQETLYCDISESAMDVKGGYESAQVKAEIALIAAAGKLPYGWFHKRIIRMPRELNAKFIFEKTEKRTMIEYGEKPLERHSVAFRYFYKGEFDPKKALQGIDWTEN